MRGQIIIRPAARLGAVREHPLQGHAAPGELVHRAIHRPHGASPQHGLDDVLAVLDGIHDLGQLSLVQVLGADRWVHAGPRENHPRIDRT